MGGPAGPRRAGRHFHRERVPPPRSPCSPSSPTLTPTGELGPTPTPPQPPASPTLSASWRRPSSPSGERREGDPGSHRPAPRWRQPSGGESGRAAGERGVGPPAGGPPTPHSLTRSRSPRPSPDSARCRHRRPNLPPSTSDTPRGASNADSNARGQGRPAGPRGALPTTTVVPSQPSPAATTAEGAAQHKTLAMGGWEGASEGGAGRSAPGGPRCSRET